MKQLTLDDRTYELAEKLASRTATTVEQAVADAIRERAARSADPRAIIGLPDDEPELVDMIIEWAMESRSRPLLSGGL
jgi:hypothetical protein